MCDSVNAYRSECYDYLFSIAVQMKQAGLDPEKFENALQA